MLNIDKLSGMLLDQPALETIMFVGQEPDFSATVGELIGGGLIEFKKGGLAMVELPNPHKCHGELVWLIPPKILVR